MAYGLTPHAARAVLLAAAIAFAAPTHAVPQTASGVGTRACTGFNAAIEKDSDLAIDAYVAWSQGFISAFNWSNVRGLDVRIDAAGILSSLGAYCAAHPRARVYTGVQELIRRNAR